MGVTAQNNGNYGGNLINQKYTPLEGIDFVGQGGIPAFCINLFNKRTQAFNQLLIQFNNLRFYTKIWSDFNRGIPPMVVVSSGRANWMRSILQNSENKTFKGYTDASTFDNNIVIPWYAPARSKRPLFVVVHWSEYEYYHSKIGDFHNVKVIGYKFTGQNVDLVGFGASRFAALALMINLNYSKVWAVDDNVVNINGFPKTLDEIEAHMDQNTWGIGFTSATDNIKQENLNNAGVVNFNLQNLNLNNDNAGLLQQVALWNLNLFRNHNINFSPIFVTSNEDVSLCNYLKSSNRQYAKIDSLHIVKINPINDKLNFQSFQDYNEGAIHQIPRWRRLICRNLCSIEADLEINNNTRLDDYVKDTVIPGTPFTPQDSLITQMRAMEQILSAAIRKGNAYYPQNIFVHPNMQIGRFYPAVL